MSLSDGLSPKGAILENLAGLPPDLIERAIASVKILRQEAEVASLVSKTIDDATTVTVVNVEEEKWKPSDNSARRIFDIKLDSQVAWATTHVQALVTDVVKTGILAGCPSAPSSCQVEFCLSDNEVEVYASHGPQIPIRDTSSPDEGNIAVVVGLSESETFWFYPGSHLLMADLVKANAHFPGGDLTCEVMKRSDLPIDCLCFGVGDVVVYDKRLIHFFGRNTSETSSYRLRLTVHPHEPQKTPCSDIQLVAFQQTPVVKGGAS